MDDHSSSGNGCDVSGLSVHELYGRRVYGAGIARVGNDDTVCGNLCERSGGGLPEDWERRDCGVYRDAGLSKKAFIKSVFYS